MIVRIRDLVSALMLFPLALSGFALGVTFATIVQEGLSPGNLLVGLVCAAIPIAYFGGIITHTRTNPKHRYFGELSPQVFVILAGIAYALPLAGATVLFMAYS